MLQNFFKKAFALKGVELSDEQIGKITSEFEGLLIFKVLADSTKKLEPADMEKIKEYSKKKDYKSVMLLVKSKYQEKEWDELLKRRLAVLVGDYLENVVGFKR